MSLAEAFSSFSATLTRHIQHTSCSSFGTTALADCWLLLLLCNASATVGEVAVQLSGAEMSTVELIVKRQGFWGLEVAIRVNAYKKTSLSLLSL